MFIRLVVESCPFRTQLHAIFELIMEYERNAISLDTSKITVRPVLVKTKNPSCYRISIARKRYQNSKNNVVSRSS